MSDVSSQPVCFIDSNIWLYAFIEANETIKEARARSIIRDNSNIVISTQVINEVSVNLIKKAGFAEDEIRQLVTSFYQRYTVSNISPDTLLLASQLREKYQCSYWDSLIIASALESGASIIYSEDMHDGLLVDGRLTIINPFKSKEELDD
jgi:predicted nucleic acid-binding protein